MRLRALVAASLLSPPLVGLQPLSGLADASAQSLPPPVLRGGLDWQVIGMPRDLQLEVFVNGRSTELVAHFQQETDGTLRIDPEQLDNVGIAPAPQARLPDGSIAIQRLPNVTYVFDEATQSIHFTIGPDAASTRVIDAHDPAPEASPADSSLGGLVNYTVYGSAGGQDAWGFEGVSGWFEGRLFSPYSVLSHAQLAGTSSTGEWQETVRLDTSWSYSDPKTMISYRGGDFITGGLPWTRPTRLGGLQIQRNFGLRPDLVTMPLPDLSGSAAVPSTVEVYVNNSRRVTEEVPAGPFEVTNLPVVTGSGTARVVVRDALGRETVSETPFFASSSLLAPGLWDFSAESGFARRSYGVESNDYDGRFMVSATSRYGLNDWLTLEAHGEGGAGGLVNGGAGAVFGLGSLGVGSFAAAGSTYEGMTGYQLAGGVELQLWDFYLSARAQYAFGDYLDIAAVTAEPSSSDLDPLMSAAPPRSLQQVSLGVPLKFDPSTLNVSYAALETAQGDASRLLGLSYSRAIGERATLFATTYKDLAQDDSYGVFGGLSMSFGNGVLGSVGASREPEGTIVRTDLVKSLGTEIGSVGWRISDAEGATSERHASGSYRSSFARFDAGVDQYEDSARVSGQVEGAVVVSGGSVFLSNRIDDAFAVVDAGAPDVEVQYENRPVGRTGRNGKLLVTNLRSYEPNRISIDPTNLPVDATVESTREIAVPAERSGTVVRFGVDAAARAVLVTLRDEDGAYIEAGSTGRLAGGSESFVVGYDGQAYITGLGPQSTVVIDQPSRGRCEASLAFKPAPGAQAAIPDAVCRRVQ